jgi:hypothetical protein
MKAVQLSGKRAAGRVALVDDEDWPLVADHLWWVLENKRKSGTSLHGPYAYTEFRDGDGRLVRPYMHSLITGWPMTDHIDHDGLNNQRFNLRPATSAQNLHNQRLRVGAASRFKGVTWHAKRRKWQARIGIGGRNLYLGLFASEEDAALAYNAAALEIYGAYAYLNPVDGKPTAPAA